MNLKLFFKLHITLLPLIILSVGLLIIAQPPNLAAGSELRQLAAGNDQVGNFLASNTQPKLIASQQITVSTYSSATVLLEATGGSTVELLSAYAGAANPIENRFGGVSILKEGDTYYLWLGSWLRTGSLSNYSSVEQRFESQDGLVWRNRTDTNLATTNNSYRFVYGLRQVIKNGSIYEGWDQYYYEWSSGWGYALRYVTSTNGITWTVINQPALIGANHTSVIKNGSTYHMWVHPNGDTPYSGTTSLRYRVSTNGGTSWGHWQTGGILVMVDGTKEVVNATRVRQLTDGTYQLFYLDGSYIKVATSSDGSNFTTQITNLLNIVDVLPTSIYVEDFTAVEVNGEDWFYFVYCDKLGGPYNSCVSSRIAVTRPIHRTTLQHVYLPVILSNWPSTGFPIHIGNAIPTRPVAYQGEIFYNKAVQIPDQLPVGGHFYFSTRPDVVTPVLVDDEMAVLLNGAEIFTYDFSSLGSPRSAILEVPRVTMEQLAGQIVTIQYRDIYGVVVSATEMWLIWIP